MSKASFERALKMRREIEEAAAKGDEYAKVLKKGYDECNPAVLGMRWPMESTGDRHGTDC